MRAPDFRGVESWLNTDQPLTIKELRGQVVLLDFWTYCCINCMHVFPDLKYLEDKYHGQPFVVVGVHSGKFSEEKDPANIRQAILRNDITHPVAVDSRYQIWNAYGVEAWPTLILIDPEGYVVGRFAGEGHRDAVDKSIARLLAEYRGRGILGAPMKFKTERSAFRPGVLEFPSKVLADAASKRLFISDTNHQRVLVADLEGRVSRVIGSGQAGPQDGPADRAEFHQPQGLALSADGNTLYVADTENHAIRAVDLKSGQVTTVVGTGKQSRDYDASGPGPKTALSSPWALARVGDRLYIAMAGTHQIWVLDLSSKRVSVFAGTGREGAVNGPNRSAAFAQPSGLATDGQRLYVADSEVSTIRAVEIKPGGRTTTVAGSDGLFDFGYRDGVGMQARFQHPLGVALSGNRLFVADSFNNRIRVIDLANGLVSTWLGTGTTQPGDPVNSASIGLFEPGGLSVAGDALYIADTNHHRILAVDIPTKKVTLVTVTLPNQR
jgi:DNA-binding beta-propeller fold protein YncE